MRDVFWRTSRAPVPTGALCIGSGTAHCRVPQRAGPRGASFPAVTAVRSALNSARPPTRPWVNAASCDQPMPPRKPTQAPARLGVRSIGSRRRGTTTAGTWCRRPASRALGRCAAILTAAVDATSASNRLRLRCRRHRRPPLHPSCRPVPLATALRSLRTSRACAPRGAPTIVLAAFTPACLGQMERAAHGTRGAGSTAARAAKRASRRYRRRVARACRAATMERWARLPTTLASTRTSSTGGRPSAP